MYVVTRRRASSSLVAFWSQNPYPVQACVPLSVHHALVTEESSSFPARLLANCDTPKRIATHWENDILEKLRVPVKKVQWIAWNKPEQGMIKVNTDGSRKNTEECGLLYDSESGQGGVATFLHSATHQICYGSYHTVTFDFRGSE